jgi:hypothetical protein
VEDNDLCAVIGSERFAIAYLSDLISAAPAATKTSQLQLRSVKL